MWILALACLLGAAPAQPPAAEPPRIGRFLKIELPIDGNSVEHVRRAVHRIRDVAQKQNQKIVLILEFDAPADRADFAASSKFGNAYDLANFLSGPELQGIETVAYVPRLLQGHGVLAAAACDFLMMAPDAKIGSAAIKDPQITAPVQAAYREIAARRQTFPPVVAQAMLGAPENVLRVQTDTDDVFVLASGLPELKQRRTIRSADKVVVRSGEQAQFTGSEALAYGFAKSVPADRRQLIRWLDLPPESVVEDPSLDETWRAVRINVTGNVHPRMIAAARKALDESVRGPSRANFVCVYIDSPGGAPAESLQLANDLAALDPGRVRTVAYIHNEALSDAALIALACDQIVLRRNAVLGGPGAHTFSEAEVHDTIRVLREQLAPRKLRSWSLPAAMINPRLDVFRYTRQGLDDFFCVDEWNELPDRDRWVKKEQITSNQGAFQATAKDAERFHLANRVVDDYSDLGRLFGIEGDPVMREPGWADILIDALRSTGAAALLLSIGFFALYIEMQTPGIGIGGFIATICFVVFFWAGFLGGTAGWLEVLLFLLGIAFLALEIFVIPGFGIFGLGGGALILVSVLLASQTFVIPANAYQFAQLRHSMLILLGAMVGFGLLAWLVQRWLPQSRGGASSIVLAPPSEEETQRIRHREALINVRDMVGQQGVTTTILIPGGKARFGDRMLDVVTEGEDIPAGTPVVIVEVYGSRIVVRAAK